MNRTRVVLQASCLALLWAASVPADGLEMQRAANVVAASAARTAGPAPVLWQSPGSIGSLNLLNGPGGRAHRPAGKFTFVEEDKGGTSPKFELVDEQGVKWKVKLGEEAKAETAATRLLWAMGYGTDEDYYLPELRVVNLPKLERGQQFVSPGGIVRGARLERKMKGQKKGGEWSWFHNPFEGTKELDGLRVMMALLNNWDLKESNNVIYQRQGEAPRYAISDLGATFGRTGDAFTRSKSNLSDYRGAKFIQKVTGSQVDFYLSSRPFILTVFHVPNYVTRTKMQSVVKDIPRAHVKWITQRLRQLSGQQIRDCFRAAGYSPQEVEGFAKVVQARIAQLKRI